MFERFTDRARRIVVLATEEARQLKHNYIGTEHLLLAMLREGEAVAAQALMGLGLDLDKVRADVIKVIGEGLEAPTGNIPFTPRGKRVLELSLREALQLGHNYIGTEHLLLGVLREGDGVGCKILTDAGLTLVQVRQKVIQLLVGYQGKPTFGPEWHGNTASQTVYYVRCPYCKTNVTDGAAHATRDEAIVAAKEAGAVAVANSVACKACQPRTLSDFLAELPVV